MADSEEPDVVIPIPATLPRQQLRREEIRRCVLGEAHVGPDGVEIYGTVLWSDLEALILYLTWELCAHRESAGRK